jgi:hypothetical protein
MGSKDSQDEPAEQKERVYFAIEARQFTTDPEISRTATNASSHTVASGDSAQVLRLSVRLVPPPMSYYVPREQQLCQFRVFESPGACSAGVRRLSQPCSTPQ